MAVSTKLIHVRPNPRLSTFRPFSSSSSSTSPPHTDEKPPPHTDDKPPEPNSRSHLNSYLSDVKSTLKQSQQFNPPFRTVTSPPPPPNSSISPSKLPSLEEIGKTLAGFRHRNVSPPHGPQSPPPGTHIQFQDILQSNDNSRSQGLSSFNDGKFGKDKEIAFGAIRESLNKFNLKPTNPKINSSYSEYQKTLKLRPSIDGGNESHPVIGGTNAFPFELSGKEKGGAEYIPEMRTEFVKYYSVRDLGEKLIFLRPENKGDKKDWFSLEELNERLVKLREMDSKLDEGNHYNHLKNAIRTIDVQDNKKKMQRLNTLSHFGRTPSFMLKPPQEELVEKFFHPDNMSASEKLKFQLEKVREEFKMSETDCGSSRVQVAQLTTKINHLASVLHKKDKHSRKGLQAMLQKRKSLLKYLRRTDWESYCFVLSRLGLRDNPDAKR